MLRDFWCATFIDACTGGSQHHLGHIAAGCGGMEMQAPGILQRFRLAIFGDPLPPLDPRLAAMEQVFKAPPLTRSLTRSIELLAPHLNLRPTEADRALWQAEQNAECWADWEALGDVLPTIRTPARILEIGPGLGRSLVFFSKKLGWED